MQYSDLRGLNQNRHQKLNNQMFSINQLWQEKLCRGSPHALIDDKLEG